MGVGESRTGRTGPVTGTKYSFHPKSPNQLGELRAISIRNGETLWNQRRRAPYQTATLTTAGGLVFVGSWDRYVFAYDAKTGDLLWQARLPMMTNGFPITYAVGGKQYVAVGTGASIPLSTWSEVEPRELIPEMHNPRAANNGIFVFALPDE
jgi:alcohol dehydrogenase (cytochrome c)